MIHGFNPCPEKVIIAAMSLTIKDVDHIAKLARLDLTEEEKKRYLGQLRAILDHVAQLQALDTASIPPMASASDSQGQLRRDEPHPGLPVKKVLGNAPDSANDQFRIPPVFE